MARVARDKVPPRTNSEQRCRWRWWTRARALRRSGWNDPLHCELRVRMGHGGFHSRNFRVKRQISCAWSCKTSRQKHRRISVENSNYGVWRVPISDFRRLTTRAWVLN